jgi:primosomal protein N'
VIVQSQNPTHYALVALAKQDLGDFYGPELTFRAQLGYPPFRRLARLTADGSDAAVAEASARAAAGALRDVPGLTVYPPLPDRRNRVRRLVVKGGPDLPRVLAEALGRPGGPWSRGIIDVEVDPVEWPS